jgi:integrase
MGEYRKIDKGVNVRTYKSGKKAYVISLTYRGITCRETLNNIEITRANDRYAKNLKAEIDGRIARDSFRYTDYFPESKNARKFGHAVSTLSVRDLLTNWLKDIKRSHPHSTYRAYKKVTDAVLIPHLGDFRATDLATNPEPIKQMIRSRKVTQKTIRNELTPLRAVFDIALNDNIVERNPMDKIKVKLLVPRSQVSKPEPDPYSAHEIQQLLTACQQHKPKWKPYWQFVFFSGVRPSEGYALKWTKIDWKKQTALIDAATVERKEKETKTKSSTRQLPLLPMALQALTEQKANTATWCEHVFANPRTRAAIIDYEETASVLKYLCQKTGIRFREQKQTRHSFASNLLSGGENPYRVAKMLGHKNVEMVYRVYGTWIDQAQGEQQEYVSDFANLVEKKNEYV